MKETLVEGRFRTWIEDLEVGAGVGSLLLAFAAIAVGCQCEKGKQTRKDSRGAEGSKESEAYLGEVGGGMRLVEFLAGSVVDHVGA